MIIKLVRGRIKKFRYFDEVILNTALPYVYDDLRIVCSITNAFQSPYLQDFTEDDRIAKLMLERRSKRNAVEQR